MAQQATVLLRNLNEASTHASVAAALAEFGPVKRVDVIRGRGFGFVRFATAADAQKAVRAGRENGIDVDGEYWAGVTRKLNEMEHATRFVDLQTFCDALNQGNATLAVARQKWDDGSYDLALERYEGGASALEFLRVRNSEDAAKLSELQTRFFRNAAACALKLDRWCLAQRLCRKALAIDPDDVSARFKLGVAYARRGDAGRADACFAAIVAAGGDGAAAAARERVKLREQAAPTVEHGFLGRGAFSEGRASCDDEGLRRKLAARLCVDPWVDDRPACVARRGPAPDRPHVYLFPEVLVP